MIRQVSALEKVDAPTDVKLSVSPLEHVPLASNRLQLLLSRMHSEVSVTRHGKRCGREHTKPHFLMAACKHKVEMRI